jgi:acyl-coenzyme A thioesterase PaaI-like protein
MFMQNEPLSLQERYAPHGVCHGCGPANQDGLHIRSFVEGEQLVAEWQPSPKYQSFPGYLYGGLIGSLFDCHSNWAAAWHLMRRDELKHPPSTVTSELKIKFLRPTPSTDKVRLISEIAQSAGSRIVVSTRLVSDKEVCATCLAVIVCVKPNHPAYNRW